MNFRYLLMVLFLFPICLFAGIVGEYRVSGYNPVLNEDYTGCATITKEDSVYSIAWTIKEASDDSLTYYVGTGVRKGNCISFVFKQVGTSDFGTQLYKIHGEHLEGPWIPFGFTRKGYEELRRVNCP